MLDTQNALINEQDQEIACLKTEKDHFFRQAVDLAREAREGRETIDELRVRLGIAESFIPVDRLTIYELRLKARDEVRAFAVGGS